MRPTTVRAMIGLLLVLVFVDTLDAGILRRGRRRSAGRHCQSTCQACQPTGTISVTADYYCRYASIARYFNGTMCVYESYQVRTCPNGSYQVMQSTCNLSTNASCDSGLGHCFSRERGSDSEDEQVPLPASVSSFVGRRHVWSPELGTGIGQYITEVIHSGYSVEFHQVALPGVDNMGNPAQRWVRLVWLTRGFERVGLGFEMSGKHPDGHAIPVVPGNLVRWRPVNGSISEEVAPSFSIVARIGGQNRHYVVRMK